MSIYARAGVAAWNFVVKNPAGQILTTVGITQLADSVYNWWTGEPSQGELIQELAQVRQKLNDPTTDPDEWKDLAERDGEIQALLAQQGLTVEAASETGAGISSAEMIDVDGDDEYTLSELARLESTMQTLSVHLRVSRSKLPDVVQGLQQLMQMSKEDLIMLNNALGG